MATIEHMTAEPEVALGMTLNCKIERFAPGAFWMLISRFIFKH